MEEKFVICLGREYGSGGHNIGKRLSEMLGIDYYDKKLLDEAAKKSGISQEYFAKSDEKAPGSLAHTLASGLFVGSGMFMYNNSLSSESIFKFQSETILQLAEQKSCIIVGRCADYVLRDADVRLLRVFVSAPEEQRIARKMEQEHLTQPQAARLLRKMDKQRRKYYETYTHHVWGDSTNYDLCIDTSTCTLDEAAARIADRFRAMA